MVSVRVGCGNRAQMLLGVSSGSAHLPLLPCGALLRSQLPPNALPPRSDDHDRSQAGAGHGPATAPARRQPPPRPSAARSCAGESKGQTLLEASAHPAAGLCCESIEL